VEVRVEKTDLKPVLDAVENVMKELHELREDRARESAQKPFQNLEMRLEGKIKELDDRIREVELRKTDLDVREVALQKQETELKF